MSAVCRAKEAAAMHADPDYLESVGRVEGKPAA